MLLILMEMAAAVSNFDIWLKTEDGDYIRRGMLNGRNDEIKYNGRKRIYERKCKFCSQFTSEMYTCAKCPVNGRQEDCGESMKDYFKSQCQNNIFTIKRADRIEGKTRAFLNDRVMCQDCFLMHVLSDIESSGAPSEEHWGISLELFECDPAMMKDKKMLDKYAHDTGNWLAALEDVKATVSVLMWSLRNSYHQNSLLDDKTISRDLLVDPMVRMEDILKCLNDMDRLYSTEMNSLFKEMKEKTALKRKSKLSRQND